MHGPHTSFPRGLKEPLHLPSNHCGWDMWPALVTNLQYDMFHPRCTCRLTLASWLLAASLLYSGALPPLGSINLHPVVSGWKDSHVK